MSTNQKRPRAASSRLGKLKMGMKGKIVVKRWKSRTILKNTCGRNTRRWLLLVALTLFCNSWSTFKFFLKLTTLSTPKVCKNLILESNESFYTSTDKTILVLRLFCQPSQIIKRYVLSSCLTIVSRKNLCRQ